MTTVRIEQIAIDAGTQIRAAINEQVVTDYAERMTDGTEFPPVVLFHDGSGYFLADGFHRVMAATRNQFRDITADVRPGTKTDALWFALGANKANGQRMSPKDRRHAIEMALQAFPDRSANALAEQIGVSQDYVNLIRALVKDSLNLPDRVTGKDGKTYPASRPVSKQDHPKAAEIESRLRAGESVVAIAKALHVASETIAAIRKAAGLEFTDKSRGAITERRQRIADMAADGHSSRQIAAATGLSEQSVKKQAQGMGVDIPADRAVGKVRRHDAARIVEAIVMDAENLTAEVNLIDFAALDLVSIPRWVDSLAASEKSLSAFIRRLRKELSRVQVA